MRINDVGQVRTVDIFRNVSNGRVKKI